MLFDEDLKELKEKELKTERLLLIKGDLMAVIVSWPHVKKRIDKHEYEIGDNLWDVVLVSTAQWMEVAAIPGVTKPRFTKLIQRVKDLGFIFPDGTLPQDVSDYLRMLVYGAGSVKKR